MSPSVALTAEELTAWFTMDLGDDGTFPFVEDEAANIHGYGHQPKAEFAAAVNRYDAAMGAVELDDLWNADHIAHRWAVMDPDGEMFWVVRDGHPVTAETPGAFPITTLWGQR